MDAPSTTAATQKLLMVNNNNLFSGSRHNSVYLTTIEAPAAIVNEVNTSILEKSETKENLYLDAANGGNQGTLLKLTPYSTIKNSIELYVSG